MIGYTAAIIGGIIGFIAGNAAKRIKHANIFLVFTPVVIEIILLIIFMFAQTDHPTLRYKLEYGFWAMLENTFIGVLAYILSAFYEYNRDEPTIKEIEQKAMQKKTEEERGKAQRIENERLKKDEEKSKSLTEAKNKEKREAMINNMKTKLSLIKDFFNANKKKIYIGLGAIAVLLYLTNPSMADFKSYTDFDIPIKSDESRTYARTGYWLIFSKYTVRINDYYGSTWEREYWGYFNTFQKIED
jgi:hypothetical protein